MVREPKVGAEADKLPKRNEWKGFTRVLCRCLYVVEQKVRNEAGKP